MTETTLSRDCPAILIPSGEETILPAGTELIITQCLANTLTIATRIGLARIAGEDVDALGNDYETIERELQERAAKSNRSASSFSSDAKGAALSPEDRDEDRVKCPFCDHILYPGSDTAAEGGWVWDDDVCDHTLFLALQLSGFTGFQYRSKLFNRHFGLPDTDDSEIRIPSTEDPEDYLSIDEITQKLKEQMPGLELRSYCEEGGMACGPVPGGTVTFGFVPNGAAS